MAGKKILVADDSLTIQKVIRLALSNEGYDIQAVSDGNDCLQQIAVFRPHVVLIDVSLPAKSAFEVKRAINELGDETTRFILMSSAFEKVDEEKVAEVHFHGHLTKPFDPAHLRHVLSEVIASLEPAPEAPSVELEAPQFVLGPSAPETEPTLTSLLPPLPDAPVLSDAPDADIKHLTESTIKMSGLDDFQWTVNESAKKTAPTPPPAPPAQMSPPPPSAPPSLFDSNFAPPPDPMLKPLPGSFDLEDSRFSMDAQPAAPAESLADSQNLQFTPPPPPVEFNYNEEQMKELIQAQAQLMIEKMAKEMLPEVAERVIKAEIHRLLQEQF